MSPRVAALLFLLGCEGGVDTGAPQEAEVPLPEVSAPAVSDAPQAPAPAASGRQKKRMTVAQVRDSMERISGGVVWGQDGRSDWDSYAATLGVADYQLRTTSERSASVLFQKFLADAAAQTCEGWIDAHAGGFFSIDDPSTTAQEAVRENVQALRWRVQGRPRAEEVPVVDDYVDLFATVYRRSQRTEEAWHAVCVAMFTHPDFFLY